MNKIKNKSSTQSEEIIKEIEKIEEALHNYRITTVKRRLKKLKQLLSK